jgi:hypothetical protein
VGTQAQHSCEPLYQGLWSWWLLLLLGPGLGICRWVGTLLLLLLLRHRLRIITWPPLLLLLLLHMQRLLLLLAGGVLGARLQQLLWVIHHFLRIHLLQLLLLFLHLLLSGSVPLCVYIEIILVILLLQLLLHVLLLLWRLDWAALVKLPPILSLHRLLLLLLPVVSLLLSLLWHLGNHSSLARTPSTCAAGWLAIS